MTLKEKWIEALRSGDYAQCFRQMRYKDTYCATGVAWDIMGNQWEPISDDPDRFRIDSIYTGLEIAKQMQIHPADLARIITMNDTEHPFTTIADYIESLPPFAKITSIQEAP